MAKFLFSLETLLRHREDTEQRERDELSRLTYKYQTELRHRDDLRLKFSESIKELSFKQSENAPHQELNWFYLYLKRLTHEIEESEKYLVQLDSAVQAQKEVVVEAGRKKKVLATLKSRREREFTVATEKREQKEVDELVVTRFGAGQPEPDVEKQS